MAEYSTQMEDPFALLDPDAALLPLLEAAKDSLGSVPTIRALVNKILSHPEIFCGYDQLKVLLVNGKINDDTLLLATLDLFSYGDYSAYVQNPSAYLPLNARQISKIQQLTLLSCVQGACERGQSSISYTVIGEALQISDQRALEQVIVSCLNSRVLNGRLCQKSRQLLITNVPVCISRDVAPEKMPSMIHQLQGLQERLATSHTGLEEAHSDVSQSIAQSAAYWKALEDRHSKMQANSSSGSGVGGGTVRLAGWPESGVGARRSSASRQSNKRSRGGLGGTFPDPFQRY